jgi:hypothetical protein
VFDVTMTTLLLSAAMVARRYETGAPIGRRVLLLSLGLAAFLSKETGAVGPVILLVDAWMRRARSRSVYVDLGILLGLNLAVSLVRLLTRFDVASAEINKYIVQRTLFGAFGSLAVPWHQDTLDTSTLFALVSGVGVIAMLTLFFVSRRAGRQALVWGGAAWILVSILPVFPILFVPPDLQGSRYLYLASVGWALVLCGAGLEVAGSRPLMARVMLGFLMVLVANSAYGTRIHLRHWSEAARLRDAVQEAARQDSGIRSCAKPILDQLPDNLRGAYIFRTNAREAFERDSRMTVAIASVPREPPNEAGRHWLVHVSVHLGPHHPRQELGCRR